VTTLTPISFRCVLSKGATNAQNDDVLVIERVGQFVEAAFRLPGQVRSEAMCLWSSIGWGTPAALHGNG